jgi:hypothetical protein
MLISRRAAKSPFTLLNSCVAGSVLRRNLTGPTPLYHRGKPPKISQKPAPYVKGAKGVFLLGSARNKLNWGWAFLAIAVIILSMGCGGGVTVSPSSRPTPPIRQLALMGYSIQVGAFANLDNAVRLSKTLRGHGLDAYYFIHKTGLYKVRFGDFPSKESARRKAETIRAAGIIDDYYLVSPDDYAVVKQRRHGGRRYLRDEIVGTAKRFIGVPYRWGGSSPSQGFDCSGLTMVVYQLNGLNLPRSSREQYRVGTPVKQNKLSRGDLVFFATSGGRRVSHVGIYAGGGRFIHAPRRGKRIRTELLTNRYFKARYVGARTYLPY